ncbi:MAG: carboxypeptidase-like regulatory domain-containing protein [Planctomycetota bacterium]
MNRDYLLIGLIVLALVVVSVDLFWNDFFGSEDTELSTENEADDLGEEGRKTRRGGGIKPEGPEFPKALSQPSPSPTKDGVELDAYGVPYAKIQGRVLSPSGQGLPGVTLNLCRDLSPDGRETLRGPVLKSETSGENGYFEIEQVEAHDLYVLKATHRDFAAQEIKDLKLHAGVAKNLVVQLRAGFSVAGTVIEAGSKAPVSGAEVVFYDLVGRADDFESTIERTTISDAEGRYRVDGLGRGFKRAVARCEGYASDTYFQMRVDPNSTRRPLNFTLGVSHSISGKVMDHQRQPLAGAAVSISSVPIKAGAKKGHFPNVESNANGEYRFDALPKGFYTVRAAKVGYRHGTSTRRHRRGAKVTLEMIGRSAVNANAGQKGVDLVLERGAVAKGIVVDDETSLPLKAFEIVACHKEDVLVRSLDNTRRFRDEDGEFTFSAPLLDSFLERMTIYATAPGYAGGSVEIVRVDPEATDAASYTGLLIRVKRGSKIKARVVDTKGNPVVGATVTAVVTPKPSASEGRLFDIFLLHTPRGGKIAKTGAGGQVAIDGLLPGYYRIRIDHPKYATKFVEGGYDIEDVGERDLGDLEIYRGARVQGSVVGANGKPIEGCEVQLAPNDRRNKMHLARTGISGVFELRNVQPGKYRLTVVSVRGMRRQITGRINFGRGDGGVELLLADGDRVTKKLKLQDQ